VIRSPKIKRRRRFENGDVVGYGLIGALTSAPTFHLNVGIGHTHAPLLAPGGGLE
jgi:hypothetical protein